MPKAAPKKSAPVVTKQAPKPSPKQGSVLDRIGWSDSTETIKCAFYGQSGTGKTTLWATFPGPILAVICSGGMKNAGELKSIDTPEYRKKIKPVVIQDSSEIRDVVAYAESGEFGTVVLDHGSGLQDLQLKEVLGIKDIPVQKSWGLASQQQYGQVAIQWKECVRAILNLPNNVVIVTQERDFTTEGGNTTDILLPTIGPALMPSLTGWLNPTVDYIVQTVKRPKMVEKTIKVAGKEIKTEERVKGVDYCIRVGPHDVFTTKFRIPKGRELPEFISNPTYEKIMKVIKGG